MTDARNDARATVMAACRATTGFAIGGAIFGLMLGSAAVVRGIPADQAVVAGATMYAGAAQLAAISQWAWPVPFLALALSTAMISSRNILMGVTMTPILRPLRWYWRLLGIFLLVDAAWAITMKERRRPDVALYYFASTGFMGITWIIGITLGVALPDLFDRITIEALSFGGVIFLSLIVAMLSRNRVGPRLPWIVAAGMSALLSPVIGTSWGLVASVATGAAVAFVAARRHG